MGLSFHICHFHYIQFKVRILSWLQLWGLQMFQIGVCRPPWIIQSHLPFGKNKLSMQ